MLNSKIHVNVSDMYHC